MSIFESLIGPVTELAGKFIKDKDQASRLAHEVATLSEKTAAEDRTGQREINKIEAAHRSLFVAGWRPFIGWVCGVGLLYNVLLAQLLGIWFEMPAIDSSILATTLSGMLGLGAMRSFEKFKGVNRER